MSIADREKQEYRRGNAKAWAEKEDSQYASKVVKFPTGVTAIKLKPPSMHIDVIEYVCGPHNPECDEGLLHFELTYFVHRVPSPDNFTIFPCLWSNHKQQCPICDWMRENGGRVDPELIKGMRPNTRHLMNAIDLNTKDQKIQILDVNHFARGSGFGEQVKAAINAVPQFADFARFDGGYTMVLTVQDLQMGGGKKYQAATRIDFVPRQPYPSSILQHVVNLEECLIKYSYDDLKALFLQQGPSTPPPTSASVPSREAPVGGYRREPPPPPSSQMQAPQGFEQDTQRWSSQDPPQANISAHREASQYDPPAQQPPTREAPRYADPARYAQPPGTAAGRAYEAPPPPLSPQVVNKQVPLASDYGMVVGDHVEHPRFGLCEIVRISPDQSGLTIEDANNMEYRAILPSEVKKIPKRGSGPSAPPPSPPQAPPQRETAGPPPGTPAPPVERYRDDEFDRRPPPRPAQDPRRRED